MTMAEALASGKARLAPCSDSARLDAEWLLADVLAISPGALPARSRQALDEAQRTRYEQQLARREQGEPVAYLLGTQGFWTLDLQVSPAVLIPRPDTELLVEWSRAMLPPKAEAEVADLGTGSGAIALAIARECPKARVLATDVSQAALDVAERNARLNHIANVRFAQGSWFEPLTDERFDLIVSNPPYIAAGDPHLPALRHEPLSALTDGADGLNCLREIVAGARAHLKPGAWLLVEHGYDQAAAVRELFAQAGYLDVQTRRDLGGNERASGGRLGA
ncbi:protein-(glutamine-N5) methyltransferase, release factor-specific [Hydrocarboniphaga effusa AP103]|uniref:Release factor glutamine methyltransferase n=2 Tax=Hydrocarboniphaga effusa TaxID=243629 RepID=I8T827_9GAMM|nr:protein-(glutamine-N5) methyltransferase, release factor-specific [Hydrocarboniphaga effusa AP103]EIT70095.1 protein-(glutamine-N5) methyltransferase, release factor-specific [Hydrocarboniphaga effusa AP103]